MEVGRLLTALFDLWNDFDELKIEEKLVSLGTAATNLLASPSDAATSENFSKAADDLKAALGEGMTNDAPGSVRASLRNAGLDGIMPSNILARVKQILQATPFLLPQASQSIQSLAKEVKEKKTVLVSGITSLQKMNFKASEGLSDAYEIGVLMPSTVTKDDLRTIEREFGEWIFVINHIQELVLGHPESTIPVHSVSTGSLDLYCGFHATGAEALTILTLGAYTMLQYVRDAQKRRKELEELKYPKDVIEPMLRHENGMIEAGKLELVEKLLAKKSLQLPPNRENELRTALKRAVSFVLRRLNEGVDVEVSTPPESDDDVTSAKAEVQELRASIERMRLDMRKITATLPDRSTPMLQLPEPDSAEFHPEEQTAGEEKHAHTKKKKTDKEG